MSKSDIIENFLKIAQEKELSFSETAAKTKKQLEKDPRTDSLSIEDIAKLYKVKPNTPKGSQYKRNIIEDAHPERAIVSPSYDKLFGYVPNNNEKQDIALNILLQEPLGNGTIGQRRYAEKDLILSLVRLGNDLDSQNNEKLRVLADACLFQVSQGSFKKEGVTLLGAGLVAVPVLLGALYLQQHLSFINEGFEKNHQKLIAEIDDLLESNTNLGVGYEYTSGFKSIVQDFKNKLTNFYNLYKKIEPVIMDLEKPRTAKELLELAKRPQTDTVVKAYTALKAAADNMIPYLGDIQKNFASETFKARQVADKGFFSSLVDKTQVLHGGKGLAADDFDDVARAIPPYKKSISDLVETLQKAESVEKSAQQKIQEASAEEPAKKETPSPGGAPNAAPAEKSDMDQQLEQLEKDLGGGLL